MAARSRRPCLQRPSAAGSLALHARSATASRRAASAGGRQESSDGRCKRFRVLFPEREDDAILKFGRDRRPLLGSGLPGRQTLGVRWRDRCAAALGPAHEVEDEDDEQDDHEDPDHSITCPSDGERQLLPPSSFDSSTVKRSRRSCQPTEQRHAVFPCRVGDTGASHARAVTSAGVISVPWTKEAATGTKVRHVMTARPRCVAADTPLSQVAELMESEDVGAIPILDGSSSRG
jgi:hypothetical protein